VLQKCHTYDSWAGWDGHKTNDSFIYDSINVSP